MRFSDISQLVCIFFQVESVTDEVQHILQRIQALEISDPSAKEVADLKRRQLVKDV